MNESSFHSYGSCVLIENIYNTQMKQSIRLDVSINTDFTVNRFHCLRIAQLFAYVDIHLRTDTYSVTSTYK